MDKYFMFIQEKKKHLNELELEISSMKKELELTDNEEADLNDQLEILEEKVARETIMLCLRVSILECFLTFPAQFLFTAQMSPIANILVVLGIVSFPVVGMGIFNN